MKKFALTAATLAVIAGGMTGCGDANNDNDMGGTSPTRYTIDGTETYGNQNVTSRNYRGEGPVTDMLTVDDRNQTRHKNDSSHRRIGEAGQYNNQRQVGNGSGVINHDAYSVGPGNGVNNGREMGGTMNKDRTSRDIHESQQIQNQVEGLDGVEDARVIVSGDDVLIGIETVGTENAEKLENRIEKQVKNMLESDNKGKNVYVTTDKEHIGNIAQVDNDIRNGVGLDEVGDTISAMIEDLSDAAQQPFQDS